MEALFESLKNPNALAVAGALLILREVFAFIPKLIADKRNNSNLISAADSEMERFGEIMGQLSANLEASTLVTRNLADSVKEMFYQIKLFGAKVDELVKDVDELKARRQ